MTGPEIPPEVRFLAGAADDPAEQQRIVRAYFALAHGTPESACVQFALLATALAKRQGESAEAVRFLAEACEALRPALAANSELSARLLQARANLNPPQIQDAVRAGLVTSLDPFARALDEWTAHTAAIERKVTVAVGIAAASLGLHLFLLIFR